MIVLSPLQTQVAPGITAPLQQPLSAALAPDKTERAERQTVLRGKVRGAGGTGAHGGNAIDSTNQIFFDAIEGSI